ncbi:hypothetical protein AB0N62_38485 [Streptomyces sp. NPDC093982]|uniref:hypothetical protein n=1 Tax=Streptomyces sp. NPDC093982 TaxID=3155077 RepID=UPI0034287F35
MTKKKQALKFGIIAAPLAAGAIMGASTSASANEYNESGYTQNVSQDTQNPQNNNQNPQQTGEETQQRDKRLDINLWNGKPFIQLDTPGFHVSGETPFPGPFVGGSIGVGGDRGAHIGAEVGVKAEADTPVGSVGLGRVSIGGEASTTMGSHAGVHSAFGPSVSVGIPGTPIEAGGSAEMNFDYDFESRQGVIGGSANAYTPTGESATQGDWWTFGGGPQVTD